MITTGDISSSQSPDIPIQNPNQIMSDSTTVHRRKEGLVTTTNLLKHNDFTPTTLKEIQNDSEITPTNDDDDNDEPHFNPFLTKLQKLNKNNSLNPFH